jgi:hypothetical protein
LRKLWALPTEPQRGVQAQQLTLPDELQREVRPRIGTHLNCRLRYWPRSGHFAPNCRGRTGWALNTFKHTANGCPRFVNRICVVKVIATPLNGISLLLHERFLAALPYAARLKTAAAFPRAALPFAAALPPTSRCNGLGGGIFLCLYCSTRELIKRNVTSTGLILCFVQDKKRVDFIQFYELRKEKNQFFKYSRVSLKSKSPSGRDL